MHLLRGRADTAGAARGRGARRVYRSGRDVVPPDASMAWILIGRPRMKTNDGAWAALTPDAAPGVSFVTHAPLEASAHPRCLSDAGFSAAVVLNTGDRLRADWIPGSCASGRGAGRAASTARSCAPRPRRPISSTSRRCRASSCASTRPAAGRSSGCRTGGCVGGGRVSRVRTCPVLWPVRVDAAAVARGSPS